MNDMQKTINKYLVLICLCFLPGLILAQGSKVMIRGKVIAAFDKEGLPSANVLLVNKDERVINHASTDLDGNFSILTEPKAGDKLVVSYMGFKEYKAEIKNKTNFTIEMEDDAAVLEGVEIVAERRVNTGMMNINEKNLTISAKRISISEIADDMAGAGIDDALQGRIAGVDIVGGSGAPGTGMDIRIRGTSSINGNTQPLIVVDGFPFETEISADFDFASADEEEYSQMLSIAPEDIMEITVLKDAAATAIWGSKGANGVLQITTKRGAVSKPRVSYSFKATFKEKVKAIPTLSGEEYVTMIQEALYNSGTLYDPKAYPEFAYDVNQPFYFYNYGQNTNWYDAVRQTGFTQDHNVSISGGGSKAQYRASAGYYDQKGGVIGTSYNRISARLNVDYNVSEKIKFKASMAYTHGVNDKNYISYLDKNVDVSGMAYNRMPNMSIYEYNHLGQLTGNYFTPLTSPQGQWSSTAAKGGYYNPVAMANEGMYRITNDRITSNLSLSYHPLTWLRYQLDVGLDILNDKSKAFLPQTATGRPWNEISVNRADDKDQEAFSIQTFNKLILSHEIENHSFSGVFGLSTSEKTSQMYRATTGNNASPYMTDPSNPSRVAGQTIIGIASSKSLSRSVSAYADMHYGFMDRYFVGANVRTESSTRFGENYRWGTFPSASVRWRVSGEPFMKALTSSFLDEFSLRYSYGINGNQPKYDFRHISLYSIYDYTYLGEAGVYPANLEGVNLRWEKSTQHNIVVNFAVLKNRINVEFDWYNKKSSDQFFYGLVIPSTTGFSTTDINAGVMDNKGWELSINTVPYRNKNWRVSFNFNIAHNQNTIREISEQYPMEKGSTVANGKYLRRFELNQPIGSFYGYRYKGVYLNEDQTIARDAKGNKIYTYNDSGERIPVQMRFGYPSLDYAFQPGDAKYEDINKDGNIDYQDIVYLGNSNPRFTGGFGPSIKYKNITVNAYFNFRYGNDIMNNAKMNMESMYTFNNQSTAVLKRWRHPYNDESEAPADLLPRALYKKGYNYLGSDRYVEDGSFLRWKSLTVKYTFPKKLLNKTMFKDASISAIVQNLYIWTNYTGLDPEIKIKSDPFAGGVDDATVPRSRDITLTFSATF
ncbi:SusC/RagA family TonB-linked outer membrane protein [Bacteroides sp. 214]|uniref:SusC/RagA family TonB-linked outer membrane protein n=1 Tax=Bacteroides sp. 214 TaxID=2302935 RepID=UPI0013D7998B|nr:SusC/RagA family TonB-linked outer membrane protein [Bacteroides sp. 214]NDW11442.1 SusC/RagA family TonB-linked outer membrane protein [Bacteroides sp. 214]